MSLRCSVLGHDFGDSEVEREQEREGSEVVVTVREYETCRRCGETKLISENTNVTVAETPGGDDDGGVSADEAFSSDRGTPPRPDADAGPTTTDRETAADAGPTTTGTEADDGGLTPPSDGDDDAEILDDDGDGAAEADPDPAEPATADDEELVDLAEAGGAEEDDAAFVESTEKDDADLVEPAEEDPVPPAEPDDSTVVEAETGDQGVEGGESDDAVTDDGVILDEVEETAEREHGEWPDSDAKHPAEAEGDTPDSAVGWPESEGEDEGYDATAADDGEAADVDLGGGLSPEPTDDHEAADEPAEGHDAEFIDAEETARPTPDAGEEEVGSGIARSTAAQVPDGSTPVDRPTEFHCPRCDHVVPASRSSLRAGDICPECSMGYLAERER